MLASDMPYESGPEFDAVFAVEAAEMLKAVGHPLRLRILALLAREPRHVTSLSEELPAPQAIVSQQLRILRSHKLVGVTRQGGFATYWLAEPRVRHLLWCVAGCLRDDHKR